MLGHLNDPIWLINWLISMGIILLTSLPVHEWAHAWAAYQLGDDTAALQGRLSLNPLVHWDPIGTITMVLFGYGWGKPVPVLPHRLRGNRRLSMALVGLAGPFSNLVLAMVASIPFKLNWLSLLYSRYNISIIEPIAQVLVTFITINLGLMVFNLIPIPLLDGSRAFAWLLPPGWTAVLDGLERYGGQVMILVLFLLSRIGVLSLVITPVIMVMLRALGVY